MLNSTEYLPVPIYKDTEMNDTNPVIEELTVHTLREWHVDTR